jgi:hypothetical protein
MQNQIKMNRWTYCLWHNMNITIFNAFSNIINDFLFQITVYTLHVQSVNKLWILWLKILKRGWSKHASLTYYSCWKSIQAKGLSIPQNTITFKVGKQVWFQQCIETMTLEKWDYWCFGPINIMKQIIIVPFNLPCLGFMNICPMFHYGKLTMHQQF